MNDIEDLRRRFRPDRITTLFVGESAPASGKFFYSGNTNLFRQFRNVFGGGQDFLGEFKGKGFYLDDLVLWPVNKLTKEEKEKAHRVSIQPLSERISAYQPIRIVIIGRGIKKWVREAARLAEFTGPISDVPFPNWPEHIRTFHAEMSTIIESMNG
jgi:hypothetical protein